MKITKQQFNEFEKQFLIDKLATPTYRFGQAFCNSFPQSYFYIEKIKEQDCDRLWNTLSRQEVLEIIDHYNLLDVE
jgi:hypothetical protein